MSSPHQPEVRTGSGGITMHQWHQWMISSRTEVLTNGEQALRKWGFLTALIGLIR